MTSIATVLTPEKKAARIARAKRHVAADMLISGSYIEGGKGCSIGCDALEIAGPTIDDDYHRIVAEHDGTPEWLEHLRDTIFEGLPADKRHWWHVALAEAIPTDTDLTPHYHMVCAAILRMTLRHRPTWGEPYGQQVEDAINGVIALHDARLAWSAAAWSAAAAAAAWSARSVAAAAATRATTRLESVAAWSAATASRAATRAAESAESAPTAVASVAASAAEYVAMANAIITILSGRPT